MTVKRGSIPDAPAPASGASGEPAARALELRVPAELAGERLDAVLARLLPQHSRTRIKGWIEDGRITLDRRACRPRDPAPAGARVNVAIAEEAPAGEVLAEDIPLTVAYEDRDLLIVDKPAGLVVHPGAGNPRHTLQNALLGHDPRLAALPRAGIIHRLDKDTSGLLLVARTAEAHTSLTRQLQARTVAREYLAVCTGVVTAGGTIDLPIGRHRSDRVRMAVRSDGRAAVTHYRVAERFRAHSLLRVSLETGRTHQIRLHLAHLHHPIVGDPVYGGRFARPRGVSDALAATLRGFKRQALHAAALTVDHPRSGRRLTVESPVPGDFEQLLSVLRADARDAAAESRRAR